jgi:hypothetical protein
MPNDSPPTVADTQFGERHRPSVLPLYAFSGVRQQRGERVECTAGLRDGAHFQPMAEDHDGDKGREFPPDLDLEEPKCCGERRTKGRDADMSVIIPVLPIRSLPLRRGGSHAAISEDECSEHEE